MGVNESLRQLGKDIQAEDCYKELMAAAAKNDADQDLQAKIGELNLILMNYNKEAEKGEEADQTKIGEYNNQYGAIYTEIMANENMQAYQKAQAKVEEMANYISKMMGMFLNGENPETCEPPVEQEHSCDGSCSACGGCH